MIDSLSFIILRYLNNFYLIPNYTNILLSIRWVFGITIQGGLKEKNILCELKSIDYFNFLNLKFQKGFEPQTHTSHIRFCKVSTYTK